MINVATGVDISVSDIADLVLDALGKPRDLKVHVARAARARSTGTSARPTRRERLVGWRARTSFADGLERTVSWYRDNEAWWRALLATTQTPVVSSS